MRLTLKGKNRHLLTDIIVYTNQKSSQQAVIMTMDLDESPHTLMIRKNAQHAHY